MEGGEFKPRHTVEIYCPNCGRDVDETELAMKVCGDCGFDLSNPEQHVAIVVANLSSGGATLWCMSDPLGLTDGVKGLSSGLDSARLAGKSVAKQIENIQKDGLEVAQQQAQDRLRARREAEFKKERALIRALEQWKHKKQISDEEADLKIKFVKQYGAKEWDALLRIKLDIENMERKDSEEFQHDLKAVRRVQFWCFMAALIVTLWLKFILGAF